MASCLFGFLFPLANLQIYNKDSLISRAAEHEHRLLYFYASNFADPSGFGEVQRYLGSATVTTDSSGNGNFDVNLTAATKLGEVITARATDASGNTSEFSRAVSVTINALRSAGRAMTEYTTSSPLVLSSSVALDLSTGAEITVSRSRTRESSDRSLTTSTTTVISVPILNSDKAVSPLDVLLVINYINSNGLPKGQAAAPPAYDVNGDGFVNPLDVLLIINSLNSKVSSQGEGESPNGIKPIDDFFEHFAREYSIQDEHVLALNELNAELSTKPLGRALRNRYPYSRLAK